MLGRMFSNFVFAEGHETHPPRRHKGVPVRITAVQHQTRRSTPLPVIVSAGLANRSPSLPHQNRNACGERLTAAASVPACQLRIAGKHLFTLIRVKK